ncbi:MAG: hypothetical protein NZO16_04190 [Deltaproteobacteria bacterium]|nr:hypothetical protein [Deltaproteobacteria bacterium]
MMYLIYLPAVYGLFTLVWKSLANRLIAVLVGVLTLVGLPDPGFANSMGTYFAILLFVFWNFLFHQGDYLDRSAASFGLFGALISLNFDDILITLIGVGLLTASGLGILFKNFDWKYSQKAGINYFLISAVGLMFLILAFLFDVPFRLSDFQTSFSVGRALFLLGIFIKLGLPILNPSGYPLYIEVRDGNRLAFWAVFFKFVLICLVLNLINRSESFEPFVRLISALSLLISFCFLSFVGSVRNFMAASSMFTVSLVVALSSYVDADVLMLYSFVYFASSLVALRSLDPEQVDGVLHPWLVGLALALAGGVAPLFLVVLMKFVLFNQLSSTKPIILVLFGLSAFASSYFYAKFASKFFLQPNSSKIPRESVSLILVLLLMSLLATLYPEEFFKFF